MAKKTDKVRVRLDFVVSFEEATDSQTMIGTKQFDAMLRALHRSLVGPVGSGGAKGAVQVMAGAKASMALDYRK